MAPWGFTLTWQALSKANWELLCEYLKSLLGMFVLHHQGTHETCHMKSVQNPLVWVLCSDSWHYGLMLLPVCMLMIPIPWLAEHQGLCSVV